MPKLTFSPQNAKTSRLAELYQNAKVYSLDLPAGLSCPGALDCKSQVVYMNDGSVKIKDGPQCKFRCFAASQEVVYSNTRKLRQRNFLGLKELSKSPQLMRDAILNAIPNDATIIRWHVSGDFFCYNYLKAAYMVARARPYIHFYGYTKSLTFVNKLINENLITPLPDLSIGRILPNFYLTASRGGRYDSYISSLKMREAIVVFNEVDTKLPIDHDDSHAATSGPSFALLLHGTQPAGTKASKAWSVIKKNKGGYSRK